MKNDIRNLPASIRQRLMNYARDSRLDFDYILLLYIQERFLYRLSLSKFQVSFVLKGGLLLFIQNHFKGRTTRYIDFLGHSIRNDPDAVREAIEEILKIEAEDAVRFDLGSLTVERIKENDDYEGVRITLDGYLENSRKKIQLDIGFGDALVAGPVEMVYPAMLDMETPILKAYSLDLVIAEKFEAMLKLSFANSRMKDFSDSI